MVTGNIMIHVRSTVENYDAENRPLRENPPPKSAQRDSFPKTQNKLTKPQ